MSGESTKTGSFAGSPPFFQLADGEDELLRPLAGKGGHDDLGAALVRSRDHGREVGVHLGDRVMQAVAVSALGDEHVGALGDLGGLLDRHVAPPEISREREATRVGSSLQVEHRDGAPEDVTRVAKGEGDLWGEVAL